MKYINTIQIAMNNGMTVNSNMNSIIAGPMNNTYAGPSNSDIIEPNEQYIITDSIWQKLIVFGERRSAQL